MEGCMSKDDKEISHQIRGPFEIYVLCEQLSMGLGNALVDTGSQVSLIKESSLTRGSRIRRDISSIQGITGNSMEIRGQIELKIGETSLHNFLVMDKLRMN